MKISYSAKPPNPQTKAIASPTRPPTAPGAPVALGSAGTAAPVDAVLAFPPEPSLEPALDPPLGLFPGPGVTYGKAGPG